MGRDLGIGTEQKIDIDNRRGLERIGDDSVDSKQQEQVTRRQLTINLREQSDRKADEKAERRI